MIAVPSLFTIGLFFVSGFIVSFSVVKMKFPDVPLIHDRILAKIEMYFLQ